MSWLRRGAMLSSPLTSLLLRAPPRVGSAPRPVAASLARGVSASIGGCARPTAATDAFSARRGFAGAAARRPARSLTTMGAATKRAGGKAKGGAGGRGKGSGAKAPAAKPTRPGRKGVGPPARRGLKNRLKDQAQKSASRIQPDWGDDDDDDDDELAAFNEDVPDVDPSSLGDFDDDDDDDDGGIYDDDDDDEGDGGYYDDDEDEDAPGAATTAGLSMDVDDAMFKFIPEEEREAAKAAYLRMAAGGGGGRSAEAGADDDDEDEDDAREVFAEEDIEDDLYLTDEADGLTQATVQQAKGAIVKSVRFMQACVRVKDCPPPKHPEVAVIGRSNVGKSSLVNMLTNRKDIAKTSKNPGKTRTINHFEMITGDGTWYFVDLPGYGFANAPEEARRKWAEFTREYLLGRPNLLSVMLLIDSTVKPQRLDLECLEFLGENNIPVTVVFTKVDKKRKVKSGKRANPEENVEAFCREVSEYWDELPPMIFTSSKTGDGKQAVLNHVATLRQFFREGKKGKPKNKFLEDVLKAKEEGAGD
ncbi:predicted protein [Micromonas commoda]|uniref:EngB-type G domain-containing protein n=1 Tax=Micromonas commoda (strain RCC299 / NOUM17 / CCMP2709) TaxID=296587 RepID=C1EFB2_MICCC|nr:predicted protein [Micromonas commoda]ACO67060.1 predicted protein [Micromonas commoda]|eukprot:XP_002505802.1 predicted protein [Micromonas commoda]